jgi:hypothetical protein
MAFPEVCIGVSGVLPPPSRPPLGSRPRRSQRGARDEYEGGNHIYAPMIGTNFLFDNFRSFCAVICVHLAGGDIKPPTI